MYTFDMVMDGSVQYFPLSCGSGTYTFYVFEIIEGNNALTPFPQTVNITITNNIKPYTYPNRYVYYSKNSNCVQKAAELCAGKTSDIDKISAIFLYISGNISYDYQLAATVQKGYIPNPDSTLRSKKGICFDYASLMAAMLRSQGIPTRLVIGYASPDIYHAWNEIYTEQTGWITPELFMSRIGYNIADATFYASASNKKNISDYIMNSTNYSAVYYY
ncbi:MAG: transglutaminase domain-containing protein [Oscillospiraceae bacterium]|nr:transglutaminase domain-containing protein [Oscillospiraceae bacterium]